MTVSSTARPECVFTHALGGLNKSGKPGGPSKKTHLNDSMCKLAAKTADDADLGVVLYTARGHGHSTGWEVRPGTPIRDISCCCRPLTGVPCFRQGACGPTLQLGTPFFPMPLSLSSPSPVPVSARHPPPPPSSLLIRDTSCCCRPLTGVPYLRFGPRAKGLASGDTLVFGGCSAGG